MFRIAVPFAILVLPALALSACGGGGEAAAEARPSPRRRRNPRRRSRSPCRGRRRRTPGASPVEDRGRPARRRGAWARPASPEARRPPRGPATTARSRCARPTFRRRSCRRRGRSRSATRPGRARCARSSGRGAPAARRRSWRTAGSGPFSRRSPRSTRTTPMRAASADGESSSPSTTTGSISATSISSAGSGTREATTSYWRPAAYIEGIGAFDPCRRASARCRVYEVDARGDRDRVENFARRIVRADGYPAQDDTWFVRDTGASELFAWYEIPALWEIGPAGDYVRGHGTQVASVALGWLSGIAPGAELAPSAFNFDEQWKARRSPGYIRTGSTASTGQNGSTSGNSTPTSPRPSAPTPPISTSSTSPTGEERLELRAPGAAPGRFRGGKVASRQPAADLGGRDPKRRRGFGQGSGGRRRRERRAVRAGSGRRARLSRSGAAGPQFRGRCARRRWLHRPVLQPLRPLPPDWRAARDGRHYCLAAPGADIIVSNPDPNPNDGEDDDSDFVSGTSFAAPLVAGGLAIVTEAFRG